MHAAFSVSIAHTAFIELYMLKPVGQGEGGIFISGRTLETEGIQANRARLTAASWRETAGKRQSSWDVL